MMPEARELVGDERRTALLVVDMQEDFLRPGSKLATPNGMAIVPVIAAIADAVRRHGLPVVFTREQHRLDQSDYGIELIFEPPHCSEGTGGDEIIEDLQPQLGDVVIERKRRYDAFLGTELDLCLRARHIENLLVTGVCTDICVISTVQHARNLDYRVFVIEEAVDGTSAERHQAALLCMSHVFAHVGRWREIAGVFGFEVDAVPQVPVA